MALISLPLPAASEPGRFGADGANRLINCCVERITLGGKPAIALYPRSGLAAFATLPGATGGVRALFDLDNTLYAVSGRQMYRADTSGAVVQLTGGIPADGPVYTARNMATIPQVALVAGGSVYILQANTLTELGDEDLPPPVDVDFLDGYLIYGAADGRFFWSAINASNIDALDFASAEGNPDGLVRVVVQRRELWLIGTRTIEVWIPTGDADQPFARLSGGVIEIGCRAAGSVAHVQQELVWVATDGTVRRAQGYAGQRISSHAVERAIAGVDPATITATSYDERGHSYYVLSSGTWTWVYDLAYATWTEARTDDSERWQISHVVAFDNRLIAGSATAGTLYTMSPDTYDDAGDNLVMTVRTMMPNTFPRPQRIAALYVNHVPGRGLAASSAGDDDPLMMLRKSVDGGNTWSSEMTAPMGRIGEYDARVVFRRLGLSGPAGTTFELSASAKIARGLVGAAVEMEAVAA